MRSVRDLACRIRQAFICSDFAPQRALRSDDSLHKFMQLQSEFNGQPERRRGYAGVNPSVTVLRMV